MKRNLFLVIMSILAKAALVTMSPVLSIAFLILHIIAMVRLHQYVSEIVLDSATTDEATTEAEDFLIVIHSFFSFGALIIAMAVLAYFIHKEKQPN